MRYGWRCLLGALPAQEDYGQFFVRFITCLLQTKPLSLEPWGSSIFGHATLEAWNSRGKLAAVNHGPDKIPEIFNKRSRWNLESVHEFFRGLQSYKLDPWKLAAVEPSNRTREPCGPLEARRPALPNPCHGTGEAAEGAGHFVDANDRTLTP